jgi:transcriptional regulator with XRE-family HTH domain
MEDLFMIGSNIKRLREKMGITQEELARRTHISRSSLANYESGLREPKGAILVNLASALNTTTDLLLGRTNALEALEKDIESAISGHPELMEIWSAIKNREDLQSLFREVKPMTPENVKKVIRIIKALDEEKKEF